MRARAIQVWEALPIEGSANLWGDEIYFEIPVELSPAADARVVMEAGELGYWEYRAVMRASERLDHVCCVESLETDAGPFIAIGDRFEAQIAAEKRQDAAYR